MERSLATLTCRVAKSVTEKTMIVMGKPMRGPPWNVLEEFASKVNALNLAPASSPARQARSVKMWAASLFVS